MNLQAILDRLNSIPALADKVVVGTPAQTEFVGASPYVWITSVSEGGSGSPIAGPVRQMVDLRVELTIGARTLPSMLSIRDSILGVLLNFQPDDSYHPMTFRAGRMEFGDQGYFLWRDEFMTSYYIDTR